jgi:DNA-binding transcriptional MerR regulator
MQLNELSTRSGVPIARIKFYLREGMLAQGLSTSATRASYTDEHLSRLRLIRSLTSVAGLPLNRARKVLDVLDAPEEPLPTMLGRAISALAIEPDGREDTVGEAPSVEDYPRARAAIEILGAGFEARMPALAQLESALVAVEEAGIPATEERLRSYGPHLLAIASSELAALPSEASAAVEYAVLGTVLYEPVIAALRRLAHQNIAVHAPDISRHRDS